MEERIEKGKAVMRDAIKARDIDGVCRCLVKFQELNVGAERIADVISSCPVSVFSKTGFGVKIFSNALGKEITIGQDPNWDEIAVLLSMFPKPAPEHLKAIFEIKSEFGGTIVDPEQESLL